MRTRTVRDRRCREARAKRWRVEASRKRGIRTETVELSMAYRHRSSPGSGVTQSLVHHLLGFAYERIQMRLALEALGVDFINVFRSGRAGRKPAASCHNFQAANRSAISWSPAQLSSDWLAGQIRFLHGVWREILQFCFLFRAGGRVDARGVRCAEFCRQLAVMLPGILPCAGGNLSRQ